MRVLCRFAMLALLALCTATAFAGDKQSISFTIHENATLAGVKVPAGDYKMVVDRQGEAVKFALVQNGRTLVSAPARFVELSSFSAETAVVTGPGSEIREIQVKKLKGSLVFSPAGSSASGN